MIRSSYLFIILFGVLTLQACKQSPTNDSVAESQTPSNSDASANAVWFYNFNNAQAHSIKENKPIMVYFSDGDTCSLCKQLKTNVFSTPVFNEWAKKSVVLLELDLSTKNQLPQNFNEQHQAMARSLKVNDFPTIWILKITHEPENDRFKVKPLGKIGYQETPEKFIGLLQNLTRK